MMFLKNRGVIQFIFTKFTISSTLSLSGILFSYKWYGMYSQKEPVVFVFFSYPQKGKQSTYFALVKLGLCEFDFGWICFSVVYLLKELIWNKAVASRGYASFVRGVPAGFMSNHWGGLAKSQDLKNSVADASCCFWQISLNSYCLFFIIT